MGQSPGTSPWSQAVTGLYSLEAPATPASLRISEIHFNPAESSASELAAGFDNNDFEFIEIYNSSTTGAINLNGVQFNDGVGFEFGNVNLQAGQRAVIVENENAFKERYGDSINVLGQWSGALNNDGERVTVVDASSNEIMSVNYGNNDPWYNAADGNGFSLVLEDAVNTPVDELGKYYSWTSSTVFGGTPGEASVGRTGVVVNEVLAHTDAPQSDSIELFNTTASSINVGGWYLSDAGSDLFKYQISAGTIIAAGGYLVFNESDFNVDSTGFALSGSQGDQVYLSREVAGVVLLEDDVEFGATFNGESLGRLPDGTGRLNRLAEPSFGSANGIANVGPLVISEVNYHPSDPTGDALAIDPTLTDDDLEFIEITNPSGSAIDLTDWRIRGEVDFDFAASTSLAVNESIVIVSFDPGVDANKRSAFVTHYGISSATNIVGGFGGADGSVLSNSSGRISLQQPDAPDISGLPHVVVDEVVYDDLTPWADADGSGDSLNRNSALVSGNLATSWNASTPTPGVSNLVVLAPQVANTIRDEGGVLARPDLLSTFSVIFDQDVNVSASHLLVLNNSFGGLLDTSGAGFSYNFATRTATWDFSSLPEMEASYYTFGLSSAITATTSGANLDGDGNGTAGGNYFESIYVAIPGDANLDGDVEVNEFNIITGTNTGDGATVLTNLNQSGTFSWSQGDFNADGDVDTNQQNIITGEQSGDYAVFLENIGRNVRPNNFGSLTFQSATLLTVVSEPLVEPSAVAEPVVSQSVIVAPVALPVSAALPVTPVVVEPVGLRTAIAESTLSQTAPSPVEQPSFNAEELTSEVPAIESSSFIAQANFDVLNESVNASTTAAVEGVPLVASVNSPLELQGAHELRDGIFSEDINDEEYLVAADELADLWDLPTLS